ncbi:hypothetical protein BOTBODRAFT_25703 [Botryobasidium botryosum FD-172 SS1]|uniref:Alpha/beta hydrolase fold-3 domain-containing protein n=1 Tax=Botryobasidium botryosum (strain FD-172 SS1) TaxID=930990 RepID=A0A067NAZ3_BOTB1|nr:hypothetical protein BOTBODRAFT_25703 [Botryobasidium botryosum FD-172 SS1]
MIDHLLGQPSAAWKRTQVLLVIIFWLLRIAKGNAGGPRLFWLRRINRSLTRFSPWQIIVSTLTCVYAIRHLDVIVGLGAPEPLARLYSPAFYRATWIVTALDAAFATAMSIRPKWLRDICSCLFTAYYLVYATEADEKLRRFRAICTVEMLRVQWEKTSNPYIRAATYFHRTRLPVVRQIYLPRPASSRHTKPISAWLFFSHLEQELSSATDLVLDVPGGGFISMSPRHHEDRLRHCAGRVGRPVLSIDYGKAPEYPYPWAIEECFDAYKVLIESKGRVIGMSGSAFNVVVMGDSAGGNILTSMLYKVIESHTPLPIGIVLNYAVLDFNYTSWMSESQMRVMRAEQSSGHIPGVVAEQKDHYAHKSPLAVVPDVAPRRRRTRTGSWGRSLSQAWKARSGSGGGSGGAGEPIEARVRYTEEERSRQQAELYEADTRERDRRAASGKVPIGTRIAMTSRVGYFQDRIIGQSMMRAMAILYVGPKRSPDFATDYHLSPILAPSEMLAQFPPMLMTCGEKDPFVDDTVIFAGRIREAKRDRRASAGFGRRAGRRGSTSGAGRHGHLGEGLRMSVRHPDTTGPGSGSGSGLADDDDDDDEEKWVEMRIYEGWSHAYLQMSSLLREVMPVMDQMADWIVGRFDECDPRPRPLPQSQPQPQFQPQFQPQSRGQRVGSPGRLASETAGTARTHVPPSASESTSVTAPTSASAPAVVVADKNSRAAGGVGMNRSRYEFDQAITSDGDGEADDVDMLTFTPRRKRLSYSVSCPPRTAAILDAMSPGGSGARSGSFSGGSSSSSSGATTSAVSSGNTTNSNGPRTPPPLDSTPSGDSREHAKNAAPLGEFGPRVGIVVPAGRDEGMGLAGDRRPEGTGYDDRPIFMGGGEDRVVVEDGGSCRLALGNAAAVAMPIEGGVAENTDQMGPGRTSSPPSATIGPATSSPERAGLLSEAELMRRRRMEVVFGMGETAAPDGED